MSVQITPQEIGRRFETMLSDLCECIPDLRVVGEGDVKRTYGSQVSGVDISCHHQSTHKRLYIQCKWENTPAKLERISQLITDADEIERWEPSIHHIKLWVCKTKPTINGVRKMDNADIRCLNGETFRSVLHQFWTFVKTYLGIIDTDVQFTEECLNEFARLHTTWFNIQRSDPLLKQNRANLIQRMRREHTHGVCDMEVDCC
jgi:hypothetical protein